MHTMDSKTLPPPAQSSIRSFFKPKSPIYASAPSSAAAPPKGLPVPTTTLTAPPSPLPPPSATAPPPPAPSPSQQTPSTTTAHPPIHPQASISKILPSHIAALKRINALLLCITYPDSFYTSILHPTPPPTFSRAILWSASPSSPETTAPTLIGGVVCRVEESPGAAGAASQLYIQSLTLLSPYRHLGLASAALSSILTAIVCAPLEAPITSLYAHVWTENIEGLEWYKARGFEVEGAVVSGYYRRLSPDTAWVLRRRLGPRDYLQYGGGASNASSTNGGVVTNGGTPPPPPPQSQQQGRQELENKRPLPKTGNSYQNAGPGMEWNDLPTDILLPPKAGGGGGSGSGVDSSGPPSSAVSSRSSSVVGGKKKRVYPAAAFGS